MNRPHERAPDLQGMLASWRSEPLDAGSESSRDNERQVRAIGAALRAAAERRSRRKRWARAAAGLAIAASVIAATVGGWMVTRGDSVAEQAAEPQGGVKLTLAQGPLQLLDARGQRLPEAARIGEGVELETASGQAELEFSSGARTTISSDTRLRVAEAGSGREAVYLGRGRVDVEVPKLRVPVVFSVKTPDAVVVVHGTRFSVAVDPLATAGQTRVEVTRGVVVVHAGSEEVRLVAGEHWPHEKLVDAAPITPSPAEAEELEEAERLEGKLDDKPDDKPDDKAAPARRAPRGKPHAKRAAPASRHQLALENQLFAAAMAQKKAGDAARALRLIEDFLARHPESVLLQEARVERFRLLAKLGRAREAAHHARQYLGDYRDGYARDEARDIALGAP